MVDWLDRRDFGRQFAGATGEELLENLQDALPEELEMNCEDARKAAGAPFEEMAIQP